MATDEHGEERVEVAIVCPHCNERIPLNAEQARRVASGLLAAADRMRLDGGLEVRGGDG